MAPSALTAEELTALVQRVFHPREADRALALIVDLPDEVVPDHAALARAARDRGGLGRGPGLRPARTTGWTWPSTGTATPAATTPTCPRAAWRHLGGPLPETADDAERGLGGAARADPRGSRAGAGPDGVLGHRAPEDARPPAGLPGRDHAGLRPADGPRPAPRLHGDQPPGPLPQGAPRPRRPGRPRLRGRRLGARPSLRLDLRHRTAHASGGLLPEPGTAGNLPSGESYIVPYEGERDGRPQPERGGAAGPARRRGGRATGSRATAPSRSSPTGPESRREAEHLAREPAYGNIAELGLGVLGDFGIEPIGEVLLDEKLGLHIAFGRSEHFGGQVGSVAVQPPGGRRPPGPRLRAGAPAPGGGRPRRPPAGGRAEAGPDARRAVRHRLRVIRGAAPRPRIA